MKILSNKTKKNIARIIPFGIIWLVFGLVFLVVEQTAKGDSISGTAIQIDLGVFIFAHIAIVCVGLLIGTIELLYLNNVFAKKSFAKKILYKIAFYTLLFFVITLITYPIAASLELNTHILDKRVWDKLLDYLTSFSNLSTNLQLTVSLGVSLFYAEISENIGHGVLLNFFTGKYHKPTEEERIFMFLDMKSSTTIAEKLGHIQYFELLKEYYAYLSEPVVEFSGEIYQYVGDEIVISWTVEIGIQNNNCLKCFMAMKAALNKQTDHFNEIYGLSPTFKAGFHIGKVMTGEIGVIKKEIIFTGDVLNTTARIQGLCNQYEVDVLISGDLIERLDLADEFQVRSLGTVELRGREEEEELFTMVEK